MNYIQQQKSPWKNAPALTAVVLFHVFLIWALVNGLGSSMIEKLEAPIKTEIIKDVTPPPPPPPPPPKPDLPPPPPQDYIPPPEVVVEQPPPPESHAIVAVQQAVKPVFVQHAAPAPVAAVDHSFSAAKFLGGSHAPISPEGYEDRAGRVVVHCTIQADGYPTNCSILNQSGGAAFASATMRWLTGSDKPRYQPETRGGKPVTVDHSWSISFQPSE